MDEDMQEIINRIIVNIEEIIKNGTKVQLIEFHNKLKQLVETFT